jgi:hypothetical protein
MRLNGVRHLGTAESVHSPFYDGLSDFAHPNYAGMLDIYQRSLITGATRNSGYFGSESLAKFVYPYNLESSRLRDTFNSNSERHSYGSNLR